jgi:NDP-sugar pyrophosphorylase family protein
MILAAGHGTRLRPFTDTIAKCMLPIGGKPILEHNIECLRKYGITEIIINLNYRPQSVIDYFGNGEKWGAQITYSLEETILGTAGAVKKAGWFFESAFIVWYGDNLSRCDLESLCRFHYARNGLATIALYHRDDVTQSGIVGLDAKDRIIRFLEKPRAGEVFSHWINAGIYVLEPAVIDVIPAGVVDFGRDIFPAMLKTGSALYGYRMSGDEKLWWVDTPQDLIKVQEELKTNWSPGA